MHELSIAMSILDIASEEADRRGGVGITAIHLKVGPLAGVAKEALLSAFELAREQTPFASSRLVVEDVPIVVHCPTCQEDRQVESIQRMYCSTCGQPTANIVSGQELEVTAMEITE